MLFNTYPFFIFLIVFIFTQIVLTRQAHRKIILLASSYFFYAYWNWKFLFLIIISTLVDYSIAILISKSQTTKYRKALLLVSIITNLSILGFFKYFNFFIENAASLLTSIGFNSNISTLELILPIGISFYTFQTMSYTIDIYRKHYKPTYNIIDFANYVAFFPQLVAGPIERASKLLPQIQAFNGFSTSKLKEGLTLMLLGYAKKVLIADSMWTIADSVFNQFTSLNSMDLLIGTIAVTFQVYFDFSGYSDIARGLGKLFNIELSINFKQPFFSQNFSEFWSRWHITLSTWLRDYILIPLGIRGIRPKVYFNIILTMTLCGLWHKASWPYIIWGSLHGFFLVSQQLIRSYIPRSFSIPKVIKMIVIYTCVALSFAIARCDSISQSLQFLAQLFSFTGTIEIQQIQILSLLLFILILFDLPSYLSNDELIILRLPAWILYSTLTILTFAIAIKIITSINYVRPFFYYQF